MRFGISPAAFWRLSLAEWLALTAPATPTPPLSRSGLDALLTAFPDDFPKDRSMSDDPNTGPRAAHGGFFHDVAQGAAAFLGIKADGEAAADSIDKAFERAGLGLTRSLTRAASDGKVSLGELAAAAIQAIDVFARGFAGRRRGAGGGLASALTGVVQTVLRARADGGPVLGGDAYLVGERGPEVFRPHTAGEISPLGGGGTTVNVTVQGQGRAGAPAIGGSDRRRPGPGRLPGGAADDHRPLRRNTPAPCGSASAPPAGWSGART